MLPDATAMIKDAQPMMKKDFVKPKKKKKYTSTAVEKAASKAKST
jgi:hypothetical protein